ncbi:MAG TPA: hypothetical protein VK812_15110 [Candidatus Binatus sp.]|jgi:hypothetical protein|nr:hypothetical protein [Candidatus Binatus sp.]
MSSPHLTIPPDEHRLLLTHLLPPRPRSEEAAFVFCQVQLTNGEMEFCFLETYLVASEEFNSRSLYGIELTDTCKAKVIKRAHDLGASLLELHSHPRASTVEFSASDRHGFEDFVPHVWWRLKKKPYAAVVVGPGNFDSLYWTTNAKSPDGILELQVGDRRLTPTGLTIKHWDLAYGF